MPGVEADPPQVGPQLVERHVAAFACSGQDDELALQRGDLAPQLVVAVVEVGDEHRQVLRRQPGEGRAARLGPQLDDDEQPEQERDGGDRQLVARRATHRRPVDAGAGDGSGRA